MPPITSKQEAADEYRERIRLLGTPWEGRPITPWPGLTSLLKFIKIRHDCTKPAEISIVNIPAERGINAASGPASEISIIPTEGYHGLLEEMPSLAGNTSSSHLIIVENICPGSLALLGGAYDIDPQFFAGHVNVLPWYRMDEKIPERLPSLPSTKKAEDFLLLRYVETREVSALDNASIHANSVLWPDGHETRLQHSAGKLIPLSRQGQEFPLMAFTRQTVSVWCQKKTNGDGWIAIMLLDPPFRLKPKHGFVGQAEYRNPGLRPKMKEEFRGDEYKQSFRQAFCHLLQQRCSADKMYLSTCATDAFLVLYEGYRIIASEWLVANEYIKRELANIELRLEKTESTFQELEALLKELYRIRRRCNKYCELVTEAASQCKNRGQALWPSTQHGNAEAISLADRHARELEADFQYVLDNMTTSISRIEKNITLLMTLVSIGEGRQGLQENGGIALLTLVATIFLPSETVATVLGLQTRYGPGANKFWVLWAVALPLTLLVVAISSLYPTGSAALNQLWAKYFRPKPRTVCKPLSGSKDEDIVLFNDPKLQMNRTSLYAVV
ncbi:hypothetical protein K469DRAFT_755601 [Zopfia rhizophila CBS 207.26]|uniref:Uncharacterized protein n=1 Tax=Zopfia rhizophila CBS 207.26 TaxID=1314779 RepID=A0A6A6DF23_9PEZI|nr:hypothetical protein K469DRAFT_755601 [Zopfia rhizophila CBS 207.26]